MQEVGLWFHVEYVQASLRGGEYFYTTYFDNIHFGDAFTGIQEVSGLLRGASRVLPGPS